MDLCFSVESGANENLEYILLVIQPYDIWFSDVASVYYWLGVMSFHL